MQYYLGPTVDPKGKFFALFLNHRSLVPCVGLAMDRLIDEVAFGLLGCKIGLDS